MSLLDKVLRNQDKHFSKYNKHFSVILETDKCLSENIRNIVVSIVKDGFSCGVEPELIKFLVSTYVGVTAAEITFDNFQDGVKVIF